MTAADLEKVRANGIEIGEGLKQRSEVICSIKRWILKLKKKGNQSIANIGQTRQHSLESTVDKEAEG